MAETRPLLVRMSGSGSAIAAIYRSVADQEAASLRIRKPGSLSLFATETRPGAPATPA